LQLSAVCRRRFFTSVIWWLCSKIRPNLSAQMTVRALAELFAHLAQGRLPFYNVSFCRLCVSKSGCILVRKKQGGASLRRVHIRNHHLHLPRMIECGPDVTFIPICADDLTADLQLLLHIGTLWRQEDNVAHPVKNISSTVSHNLCHCRTTTTGCVQCRGSSSCLRCERLCANQLAGCWARLPQSHRGFPSRYMARCYSIRDDATLRRASKATTPTAPRGHLLCRRDLHVWRLP